MVSGQSRNSDLSLTIASLTISSSPLLQPCKVAFTGTGCIFETIKNAICILLLLSLFIEIGAILTRYIRGEFIKTYIRLQGTRLQNLQVIGHRPVIVKKGTDWRKGVWKLSTIFMLKSI